MARVVHAQCVRARRNPQRRSPLAWLLGVDFTCPVIFRDGLNAVTCIINSTAAREAGCLIEAVTFDHTLNSTLLALCVVTQVFNPSACNPSSTSDENSCWCNGYDGDIFEYKFAYKADQTKDAGAQLECKVCTLPDHPLDVTSSKGCKNMTFADNPDFKDSNVGLISGVSAAVVLVIGICAGVFFLRHRIQKRLPVRTIVDLDERTT